MRGVRHRLPDRGQHDGACDQHRTKMTSEYVTTSFNELYGARLCSEQHAFKSKIFQCRLLISYRMMPCTVSIQYRNFSPGFSHSMHSSCPTTISMAKRRILTRKPSQFC